MSGQGKDATIAARVPTELRTAMEAKRDQLRAQGVHYPDGREVDLSYVIRVAVAEFVGLAATPLVAALTGLDDPPPARSDAPDTSKMAAAAAAAWPTARNSRRRVLEAIASAGDEGRTSDELVVQLSMFSAQRRLHDLKRGGWVVVAHGDGGKPRRRKTRHDSWADVYVLSPAAKKKLNDEGKLTA